MNSRDFIRNIFKTGEATEEEIAKFLLKNYFLKGDGMEDFRQDLIHRYKQSETYSNALAESFRLVLKNYSK